MRASLVVLLSLGLASPGAGAAQTAGATARLTDVSVERGEAGATVHLRTAGPARYQATLMDGPTRLVIDLSDTVYGWSRTRLAAADASPLKEVRGSQFKPSVARVVLEMTGGRPRYHIQEGPDGLVVSIEAPSVAAAPPAPRPASMARAETPPASAPPAPVVSRPAAARKPAPPPSSDGAAHDAATVPTSIVVAQAQVRPVPGAQSPVPNGSKLISLDFKDTDVLNLLRILAAESGRNIVAGPDVKGRVSVSLRNVTWEQALDTVLEVGGLSKIEKAGVIRIVSLEQLTKEREAQARVQDAVRRAEIETRTKQAEAELKEADLAAKRATAEALAEEARRRGPLVEETVRLSYADPDEVVKTLQGILGIPPEGTIPVPSTSLVPAVIGDTSQPSGGNGQRPYIAEQPFSQMFGSQAGQPRTPLVSVSQDVLSKGITIKAHRPTNSIFIRHYRTDVERIKTLIRERFDVPLPQVKIEARMEILDRNALEAIGVSWGGAAVGRSGSTTIVGRGYESSVGKIPGQTLPTQGGVLLPDGSTVLVDPTGAGGIKPGNPNLGLGALLPVSSSTGLPIGGNLVNLPFQLLPLAANANPAAGIAFGIIGDNFALHFALQALSEQGKTRTLARPEIVTVENARATMSLGEEIPYATVSSAGTQIQFKEALLKLDVTPTVIRERIGNQEINKIKMYVIVEDNSRGANVNLGAGGTPPAINKRKAETQVLMKEGERLVIGGITQTVTQNDVRKVPLLGDIPVLGWLFKSRETGEIGRELVVFITPSVLRSDQGTASK
jgi:type IV pilus assembly protein PilQ